MQQIEEIDMDSGFIELLWRVLGLEPIRIDWWHHALDLVNGGTLALTSNLVQQLPNFRVSLAFQQTLKSLLKNQACAKMGQPFSPDAWSPGAQRLPVFLRVD